MAHDPCTPAIQNWSFGLDLKIMLMTIVAFLKRAE
jgi:lipopolysaccharide/colanic/teichoic acid biosynthesis glycosyltransferase